MLNGSDHKEISASCVKIMCSKDEREIMSLLSSHFTFYIHEFLSMHYRATCELKLKFAPHTHVYVGGRVITEEHERVTQFGC
jgi:hypothetical protein